MVIGKNRNKNIYNYIDLIVVLSIIWNNRDNIRMIAQMVIGKSLNYYI